MIFQKLIDLDAAIDLIDNPKFINYGMTGTEAELENILKETTTTYNNLNGNEQISLLPKCECGYLHFYKADQYTCPRCNTKPLAQIEATVRSTMWFKKPEGIVSLFNPVVFHMLQRRFTTAGWDAMAYITDPYYKTPNKVPNWLVNLQTFLNNNDIQRGWNSFIINFDKLMTHMFDMSPFRIGKGEFDYLRLLLSGDPGTIFCNYLPIPNKVMFPYEKTNFCIYRSNSSGLATSFIQAMISIDSPIQKLSQKTRESRISKMYRAISEYEHHHIKHEISPKEAIIRRHNLGTKTPLSGRAIIISKTGPQDHEEIEIPWFMLLGAYRPMIINKLKQRGYTLNQAVNHWRESTACYSRTIAEILQELKDESPDKELWVLYDRNPSLKHGSMQFGKVKFKFDVSDKCIGYPLANIKSSNADFDGDQINVMFIIDRYLVNMVDTFLPFTNVFELTKPFKMSKNLFVSGPQVSCYSNFLRHSRERLNKHKRHHSNAN